MTSRDLRRWGQALADHPGPYLTIVLLGVFGGLGSSFRLVPDSHAMSVLAGALWALPYFGLVLLDTWRRRFRYRG